MKTIIVPTDFSDASENAAFYAADMAMSVDAEIVLMHIVAVPLTISEIPMEPDSLAISLKAADNSLKLIKEKLEIYSNGKLRISFRVSTDSFLEEVKSMGRQKELFAVIMGSSGMGKAQAFFLGSFSLSAAKYLECPLIIVPPGYSFGVIKKVGLACDMEQVLDHIPIKGIRAILDNFDARLEVLYVSDPARSIGAEVLRENRFIQICLAHYRPEIRILSHENVKQGLNDYVHDNNIDLLLVLPRHRSFVENIFHKSVSKGMMLHPQVPVMIVHH